MGFRHQKWTMNRSATWIQTINLQLSIEAITSNQYSLSLATHLELYTFNPKFEAWRRCSEKVHLTLSPMPDARMHLKPIHIHIAKSLLLQKHCTHTHIEHQQMLDGLFKNANNYDCCVSFLPKKRERKRVKERLLLQMHPPAWNICISDLGIIFFFLSNCIKNFSSKQKGECTTTLHLNWSKHIHAHSHRTQWRKKKRSS